MSDNFKFWVPLDCLHKAKDKDGNVIMKIGGIASTNAKDSDGEFLDPNGFDLTYFKQQGFLNYHHQAKNDPSAIIGEPTKAVIKPEGLYIEGILYPDNPVATSVYNMAKVLEKNSKTRRLGFSIEGKAIERDALNPKIVKKADITGCAITFSPKNPKTFLDIIKGNVDDDYQVEYYEEDEKIMKALSAGSVTGIETLNTATTGEALKADEESELKNLTDEEQKKKESEKKFLSKGEIYEQIFGRYSDITLFEAEKVYNYIKKSINMATEVNNIEQTDIEKALHNLDVATDLVKAKKLKKDESEDEDEDGDAPDYDESDDEGSMEKAGAYCTDGLMKGKAKASMMNNLMKKGFSKASVTASFSKIEKANKEAEDKKAADEELKKAYDKKKAELEDMEKGLIEKGILDKTFKKAEEVETKKEEKKESKEDEEKEGLKKALDDVSDLIKQKNYSVGIILKGVYDELQNFKTGFDALKEENAELKKAVDSSSETINTLNASIDEINKALETPNVGRKSVQVAARERNFAGNEGLEKGQQNEFGSAREINIKERKKVLDALDHATFQKGCDNEFSEAMTTFETRGTVTQHIATRLLKEHGIKLTA